MRVKIIHPGHLWYGQTGKVLKELHKPYIRDTCYQIELDTLGEKIWIWSTYVGVIDSSKEEKKAMQWQFNISREAQINHDKIAEDLSWENPLALVSVNRNEQLQIVVYGPLYDKAMEIHAYVYPGSALRTEKGHVVLYLNNGSEIERGKGWAADVRQAPWPDTYKATVKVQLLTV